MDLRDVTPLMLRRVSSSDVYLENRKAKFVTHPSLSKILSKKKFPDGKHSDKQEKLLKELQLKMLRIQQSVWHQKSLVIIVFEGFDAAGKGGAIRRLVETLDPRGFKVIPIGPPDPDDQGQSHCLYRHHL